MRIRVDGDGLPHLTGRKGSPGMPRTTPVCSLRMHRRGTSKHALKPLVALGCYSAAIVIEHKKPNCRRKIAVLTLRLNRANKVRQGHETPAPDLFKLVQNLSSRLTLVLCPPMITERLTIGDLINTNPPLHIPHSVVDLR